MDLPLIGTVDLTPSGLFLIFAALVVVGYLGWQIITARRALVRARDAEEGAPAEDAKAEPSANEPDANEPGANEPGANEPGAIEPGANAGA